MNIHPDGIYPVLPDYYESEGLSNSMMGYLEQSPAHLRTYMDAKRETTSSQLFGQVVHALVLDQPTPCVVAPDGLDLRTKEGKAWVAGHSGPIMKASDHARASAAATSVYRCGYYNQAFRNGMAEVSVFSTDEQTGVQLKGRLDYVPRGSCIVDLKTCSSARWEDFEKQFRQLHYYRQMALYLDLWNAQAKLHPEYQPKTDFLFVCVEDQPPHGVCIHHFGLTTPGTDSPCDYYRLGRAEYLALLGRYAETGHKNIWPSYDATPTWRGDAQPWQMKGVV